MIFEQFFYFFLFPNNHAGFRGFEHFLSIIFIVYKVAQMLICLSGFTFLIRNICMY